MWPIVNSDDHMIWPLRICPQASTQTKQQTDKYQTKQYASHLTPFAASKRNKAPVGALMYPKCQNIITPAEKIIQKIISFFI